ncbi:unnamed protein product, partial [Owenia fusiformis]
VELENNLNKNENLTLKCHHNCVNTYVSSFHINHAKRKPSTSSKEEPSMKRTRRSNVENFDFKSHCLFCGLDCPVKRDKKNPHRWKAAYICRTVNKSLGERSLKERILETCRKRSDDQARLVEIRVSGAVSDLHAADARYHGKCYSSFLGTRNVSAAVSGASKIELNKTDLALEKVIEEVRNDTSRMWTSTELLDYYISAGGVYFQTGNRSIMECIVKTLEGEFILLSTIGYASLLISKTFAHQILKLKSHEDDDSHIHIKNISAKIVNECKEVAPDKTCYKTRLSPDAVSSPISMTHCAKKVI